MEHHGSESGVIAVHLDGQMGAPLASDASRREFLKTLAAVGAGAVLPAKRAARADRFAGSRRQGQTDCKRKAERKKTQRSPASRLRVPR